MLQLCWNKRIREGAVYVKIFKRAVHPVFPHNFSFERQTSAVPETTISEFPLSAAAIKANRRRCYKPFSFLLVCAEMLFDQFDGERLL